MGLLDSVDKYDFKRCNYVPILPLVYDDALSYIETLYQVTNKVNEVIGTVNDIIDDNLEEAKKYTDEKIKEQIQLIDDAVKEVKAIEAELNKKYSDFETVVNAKITLQDNKVNTLSDNLVAGLASANKYTDTAILNNNEHILEEVSKGLINVKVINYFTGELIPVQEMFDYLSAFHLTNSISYEQLVASEKTYDELADYDKTYTEWVANGYNIIHG